MKLTAAQKAALKWFDGHNRDGIRTRYGTVVAAGEESPHGNATWPKLERLGLVERYGVRNRRIRLTEAGLQAVPA